MTFEEAVVAAIDFHGALTGTGSYAPPPDARGGKHKGAGVGPSPAYSYSAQVAEVTVDEETGEVTVHKVWAAHDCGRALNPVSVEGQIIGSVWMGMGQALTEEMVWKDGMLMNPGLLEYRSPSSVESPEVEPIIVESIDPEGPFGAKECSEGSLAATIPAIANAIYDAVGIRLHESPFTPERVLAALRAKKNAKYINLTEGVDPTAPSDISRAWRIAVVSRQGTGAPSAAILRAAKHPTAGAEVTIESPAIQTAAAAHVGRSDRLPCEALQCAGVPPVQARGNELRPPESVCRRHRPHPIHAAEVVRARVRARHPPHRGTERHSPAGKWRRDRSADLPDHHRALRSSANDAILY